MKLKSIVVLHIGQPVKIVVAGPDRVIVAEQAAMNHTWDPKKTTATNSSANVIKRSIIQFKLFFHNP